MKKSMADYKNILIIGAGIAGKLLKNDIEKNYPDRKVIGFVDDDIKKDEETILGKIDELSRINKIYKVDEMIIAIPSAEGSLMRRIIRNNFRNRVPIKTVPREQKTINFDYVKYKDVKNLKCGDFLGRPFRKATTSSLARFYRGKKILITGGAGSIGSEIVKQLLDLEAAKVIVYDSSEFLIFNLEQNLKERKTDSGRFELIIGNILNKNKLDAIIKKENPDMIFHAAAYKHVHLMEDNIDEAILNNVIGSKNVLDAAVRNGIRKLTFISTDKVVNPTSVMGASKKLCEFYMGRKTSKDTAFSIVRFGNVINSNGSVLPLFERQIEEYGYLTVTHKKMMRFFMSIQEAAQLVIESSVKNSTDSIHILNMGELINIYEVAQCLIRSKNLLPEKDVKIIFTGLRKGEKMKEELYTQIEKGSVVVDRRRNIFRLKNFEKCPFDISSFISRLDDVILACDHSCKIKIKKMMKQVFPSLKIK